MPLCWSKLPSFISTAAVTSGWSCLLLPRDHFHAALFSVPCSELSTTSFPKSALFLVSCFSNLISHYSFPHSLYSRHTGLAFPQNIHRLVYFRDLSTSGPWCFPFPLPYHPMVSLGLVLSLSLELPSQRDLPQHSHLQFQVCNCGLIFLP